MQLNPPAAAPVPTFTPRLLPALNNPTNASVMYISLFFLAKCVCLEASWLVIGRIKLTLLQAAVELSRFYGMSQ
jgi:hypothetical protein